MEINYPKTLVIQNSKGDATFYFAEFDIEEDNSLANGECKLNFRLYYLLASEFPEYFDLLKNKITWAFERQNGQGLFALVYSKEFKITGVEGNSPDESETSVLYVNSAEKEEIIDSLSYYHGYFFKTADKDVINYWWSERGVDIYNQGYEEYTQAQSFKDSLMPYAGALLAVGAVLAGLYMSAVQSHIALINRREIYILKSLRVSGGSLLAILLLQFAPLLLGANIIACVFGIAARVIVMRYYPYMPFNVAGGVLITLAVAAVIVGKGKYVVHVFVDPVRASDYFGPVAARGYLASVHGFRSPDFVNVSPKIHRRTKVR